MMNAIIYTRVSTAEQAKSGYSLPHQKLTLEEYCKINKINILKHFQEDFSAKNFENRPEFNSLMAFIKANKKTVDVLLFTRWDRFSRNQELSLNMIRQLKNIGIKVNAVEQPLDLDQPDSKAMLAFYLVIPEIENDKNSIRTREGMRKAMKQGYFMGSAPKGYKAYRNDEGHASLQVDFEFSKLIQDAFNEFSTGLYAAEEVRRKFYKKGLKVSKQSFLNMLRNPVYIGKLKIAEWQKEDAHIVPGLHKGIVAEDVFTKAQNILDGKKVNKIVTIKDDEFPLKGHLVCVCHDKKLTASLSTSRNGSKHSYYHGNTNCKVRYKAALVNEKFIEYLGRFQTREEINNLYNEILKEAFGGEESERLSRLKEFEKQCQLLDDRMETLKNKWLDNKIQDDDYNNLNVSLTKQIADIKNEIEDLKTRKDNLSKYLQYGISFLSSLTKFYSSSPVRIKRQIIDSIFPENLIFSDENYRTTRINHFVNLMFSIGGVSKI